jgi:hypothetical protein
MSVRRLAIYYAIVVVAIVTGKVIARTPMQREVRAQEYKMENARRIKGFPVLRLNQNPQSAAAPVDVAKTAVIQIDGADYNLVTGQAPEAAFYVSLPTFTVQNLSEKTITALSFALYNFKRTGVGVRHEQKNLKIVPGEDMVITRDRLAKERINLAKENPTTEPNGVALLTLPEMWLPGAPGEWMIVITGVCFSDDTFWQLTR